MGREAHWPRVAKSHETNWGTKKFSFTITANLPKRSVHGYSGQVSSLRRIEQGQDSKAEQVRNKITERHLNPLLPVSASIGTAVTRFRSWRTIRHTGGGGRRRLQHCATATGKFKCHPVRLSEWCSQRNKPKQIRLRRGRA